MFLDDDFLLTTETARTLFHESAQELPIIDYHCHLNPSEIAGDENFSGIVEVWLGGRAGQGGYYGDHYKWRLMRANGVPERLITGDAPEWEKFEAFAATMERAIGNPVYLWTHLELRRIFGIEQDLTTGTARSIFERTNEMLATPEFSRRNLIRRFHVETLCTTDDPADDLHFHRELASEKSFRVVPAFRPDKALNIDKPGYGSWLDRLGRAAGVSIGGFDDLVAALASRVEFFHSLGSRLSDHAFDRVRYEEATPAELDRIVATARAGRQALSESQVSQYRTALLLALMRIYQEKGWTMQLHLHAARDLNSPMFSAMGPDTGFDGMADEQIVGPMAELFDAATKAGVMPRMIVYSLNPDDWLPLAALLGCFQGGIEQRLALGNAWWFDDTRSGIRRQIATMAEQSLLGNFVGMTTDSRSFLSYPRHEYFRRILCELIGEWAERGEITSDPGQLSALVRNVSYANAKKYFTA